jgi:iron complex outermembrane receptor protein
MTRSSEVATAHCPVSDPGTAANVSHLTRVDMQATVTTAPRSRPTSTAREVRERPMNRLKSPYFRLLCCGAALALVAAAPIFAQDQPAAGEAVELQEVVVTGTRIASPNAISASPIQVVTTADIQATGKSDISDILYQLPQVLNNDLGQDFSNRTSGLSTPGGLTTADLRGLGPNRTLVLVDGRRLGQGSPQTTIASPAPDLDQIPAFLVDRIEVLTGGASSTYGSDAIAGVVNFIMKRDFQGLQVDGQLSWNQHDNRNSFMRPLLTAGGYTPLDGSKWDGKTRTFDVIAGTNFADNAGNVTAYLSYRHQDPVASANRDFGQCQLTEVTDDAGNVVGSQCFGSSNSNRFTPGTGPNAGTRFAVLGNSFVPWGTVPTTPPALFNSQPYIYMQREDDRRLAGFMAHDDLADWAKPYMDFSFMNDATHQAIAPSAAFTTGNPNTGGPYFVNCGNPFLSAQQLGILGCTPAQIGAPNQADPANQVPLTIGRRNIEGGARSSDYEHTNYRAVIGMKGDFLDAWSYDAYGQYYYVTFNAQNNNYLSYAKIDDALQVVNTAEGPQCLIGKPCAPWNIFADGGVTQEALNYLYLLGTTSGNNTLRTVHADVTGNLGKYGIKLPTARDGIGVNFGWEHRNENVHFIPDDATNSGQLSGAGGTQEPLNNSVGVSEEFVELRAPVAQDLPGVKDLVVSGGFRHSNYQYSGGVNTYKVDLQWAPVEDFRVRGSFQRAIRAPSVSELFDRQNIGLIAFGNDPCAPPVSASLQQCLNTVPASQAAAFTAVYNAGLVPQAVSGQLAQVQGGNPHLQPETSRSVSGGIVFAPSMVPGLNGSLDFWQVRIDGEVGTLPANVLVTNCLQSGDPTYCSQIVRDPNTNFSLQGATVAGGGYILQTNLNIASVLQSGIDLQTSYKLALPAALGTIRWSLFGTYLLHASTRPLPGGGSYDCAGLYGSTCQTINSRWRHNFLTTWQSPWDADLTLVWRFIGKVGNDNNDPNPLLAGNAYGQTVDGAPAFDFANRQVPNISYIDLSATWHAAKQLEVRVGVDNLFDRQPPVLTNPSLQGGGQANTFATYDSLGRQLYLAFTAKF